jgi:hypothetical protein
MEDSSLYCTPRLAWLKAYCLHDQTIQVIQDIEFQISNRWLLRVMAVIFILSWRYFR